MTACRFLFRVNFLACRATNARVISKPLHSFQKYCFYHGLEYGLIMDVKKGLQVMDPKKRKMETQTWRAVSTQSISSEARCENTDPEVVNKPVDPNTCPIAEGSDKDRSLEGELAPHEKHSISMEVGASVMRFIKGKEGATQKEIEKEMGVNIIFPSSKKDDSVIIEGTSGESVNKAAEKVQIIIEKAIKSPNLDYSHFVSLPLAIHPGLVDKLVNFQNSILGIAELNQGEDLDPNSSGDTSDEEEKDKQSVKAPLVSVELKAEDADAHVKINITNIPLVHYPAKVSKSPALESKSSKLLDLGIEKSIFIKPKTFHLTVLMLKLWNKDRVKAAAEVLQTVSSKVLDALDNRPISVRLKGLECMRGSLAKAHVLYAPVQEIGGEDRLLRACQVIIDAFVEAGLVMEKDLQHKLKLHATVMNARHRKRQKRTRKVDSFDARGIFDQYGSEEWGPGSLFGGCGFCCQLSIWFPSTLQWLDPA
ncbi:putative eukaryotic LigT [Abeliophyllum distichum]|uniref:Eukaryotic LigT n=1 Tax=Abeliophyllum distichum TaxID=126358 RepID=A0ABD1RY82_9LAMI